MTFLSRVAPGRAQRNPNDPNLKFKTYDMSIVTLMASSPIELDLKHAGKLLYYPNRAKNRLGVVDHLFLCNGFQRVAVELLTHFQNR